MSSLPSLRAFLSSLLPPLSLPSTIASPPASPSSNPHPLEPSQKPLFLTLHCLFPNELLPALDLLDRRLVTRFVLQDETISASNRGNPHSKQPLLSHVAGNASSPPSFNLDSDIQEPHHESKVQKTVYYVRSSHSRSRFASKHSKSSTSSTEGVHYEVRLQAWNCTCAAFAFAAFSGEWERPPDLGLEHVDVHGLGSDGNGGSGGNDSVLGGEPTNGGDGRDRWKIGGVTIGEDIPVCKHLLACVLAERIQGLGAFVEERIVGREELAGWAAGWGG